MSAVRPDQPSIFALLDNADVPDEIGDDELSEEEFSDVLFSAYCTALTMFTRVRALLVMAYLTSDTRRFRAIEMHALGYSSQQIANELDSTHTTILRWMKRDLPRRPEWLEEALEELEEYEPDELRAELEADEWQAWMGGFKQRATLPLVSREQLTLLD